MRWLVLLLLTGCTATVTVDRTDTGFRAKVPRGAYVKIDGFEYDGRENTSPGFFDAFGLGVGSRIGATVTGD